jgi:predicted HicB family RNase H-like nuclease
MTQTQPDAQENLKTTTIRLPEPIWEKTAILAVKRRTSVNEVILDALQRLLKKEAA